MEEINITKKTAVATIILISIISFIGGASLSVNNSYLKLNIKNCNVALIPIEGFLGSYDGQEVEGKVVVSSSEKVVRDLLLAESNPRIKAILVSIDSGGGSAFAGEEIANALKSLTKLNVAVIRDTGTSSAYWASTGADAIFASQMSSVGDMGISASYLEQTAKDAKEGYKFIEITSTKYKEAGNPHRPLSAEEKAMWLEGVKETHNIFVSEVAKNRNLSVDDVSEMANGMSFNGPSALDAGLIDGVGDIVTTIDYISNKIGKEAKICW